MDFLENNSLLIGLFAAMTLETLAPLRQLNVRHDLLWRWVPNALLLAGNLLLWRLLPVSATLGVIAVVPESWRLLDLDALPTWLMLTIAVLTLDVAYYWVHRIMHQQHWLWRIHRTHHSDEGLDYSTSVRHHPLEILVGFTLISAVVILLGIPAEGFAAFVIAESLVAPFSHSNTALPAALDAPLRKIIVTPSIHAMHHSAWQPETDSNYGILFPWWDKLFGTYCDKPKTAYADIRFGLDEFRAPSDQRIDGLLLNPFKSVTKVGTTDAGAR